MVAFFVGLCLTIQLALANEVSDPNIIGTVIDHIPVSTRSYVGSPSIAIMPDGVYVATHDFFGPGSSSDTTVVFSSNARADV